MKKSSPDNIIILIIAAFLILSAAAMSAAISAYAARQNHESEYRDFACAELGGVTEFKLAERASVDCLTEIAACEVEFADKKYEGIGQALFYSVAYEYQFGASRAPCIILIRERSSILFYRDWRKVQFAMRAVGKMRMPILYCVESADGAFRFFDCPK